MQLSYHVQPKTDFGHEDGDLTDGHQVNFTQGKTRYISGEISLKKKAGCVPQRQSY